MLMFEGSTGYLLVDFAWFVHSLIAELRFSNAFAYVDCVYPSFRISWDSTSSSCLILSSTTCTVSYLIFCCSKYAFCYSFNFLSLCLDLNASSCYSCYKWFKRNLRCWSSALYSFSHAYLFSSFQSELGSPCALCSKLNLCVPVLLILTYFIPVTDHIDGHLLTLNALLLKTKVPYPQPLLFHLSL